MLTLEEIVKATEPIFENELVFPEPPIKFKDQIKELEKLNLPKQRSSCIYDMRKWQANKLGFREMTVEQAVNILMGESFSNSKDTAEKHQFDMYNHHVDALESWSSTAVIYYKTTSDKWYVPPFMRKVKWECKWGRLDDLKREIPYGVLLRIQELKELKIINAFSVVAPIEAWLTQKDIDPIVLGHIYQLVSDDKGKMIGTGFATTYFIAKW